MSGAQPDRSYYRYTPAELADLGRQLDRDGEQRPVLLRGGAVITMDDAIGDLDPGDVLLSGQRIVSVGRDLEDEAAALDALVIDCGDTIVIPGFVDAHRHSWQGQLRRLLPDADIGSYWKTFTEFGVAEQFRPYDVQAGTLICMLGALDAGITTVLDISHNSRTEAHSDAVFAAYAESGIRAVHTPSPPFAGVWECSWPDELLRLRSRYCGTGDGLASLRLGVNRVRNLPVEELLAMAREHGFAITFDAVSGPASSTEIGSLVSQGLLGPDMALIHCNDLTEAAWSAIADAGVHVTLAPLSDVHLGISNGVPPVDECRRHGVLPSLSVDVEISLPGDLFSQMRCVLATQRMRASEVRYRGEQVELPPLSTREVLASATVAGARAAGLADRVGSISPGKDADLVLITAGDVNNLPLNDPIGTVVLGADTGNVAAVFVAGEVRKWAGQLVGHDLASVRRMAGESRDHILRSAGLDQLLRGRHTG